MAQSTSTKDSASSEPKTSASKNGAGKVKPSYKHVPHSQKPPHLVAKRNARERRRVQAVNQAFYKLRKCVPIENRNKRVSKVKTLQRAIDYIRKLERILEEDDSGQQQQLNVGQSGSQVVGSATSTTGSPTLASNGQPRQQQQTRTSTSTTTASAQRTTRERKTKRIAINCDQVSSNQAPPMAQSLDNHLQQPQIIKQKRGRKLAATACIKPVDPSVTVLMSTSSKNQHRQQQAGLQPGALMPAALEPNCQQQQHMPATTFAYGDTYCGPTYNSHQAQLAAEQQSVRDSSAYTTDYYHHQHQHEQQPNQQAAYHQSSGYLPAQAQHQQAFVPATAVDLYSGSGGTFYNGPSIGRGSSYSSAVVAVGPATADTTTAATGDAQHSPASLGYLAPLKLNDSVGSSGQSSRALNSSTSSSAAASSSRNGSSSSSGSHCSGPADSSTSISFALLQSPSGSASSASALVDSPSTKSSSSIGSIGATPNNNGDNSSPVAAAATVVCRPASCSGSSGDGSDNNRQPQQINTTTGYLAYVPESRAALAQTATNTMASSNSASNNRMEARASHLSFAANGCRPTASSKDTAANNDNDARTSSYLRQPQQQLDERKNEAPVGELHMPGSSPQQQHQVVAALNGSTATAGGPSANNLHEQQYHHHQRQSSFLNNQHHHQQQHQEQHLNSNHLSALQPQALALTNVGPTQQANQFAMPHNHGSRSNHHHLEHRLNDNSALAAHLNQHYLNQNLNHHHHQHQQHQQYQHHSLQQQQLQFADHHLHHLNHAQQQLTIEGYTSSNL